MREILFRAKRSFNKKWVTGSLVMDGNMAYIIGEAESAKNINALVNGHTVNVIPATVGQFTGLTDRYGTKIFEGDIVRMHSENDDGELWMAVVEFGNPNGEYTWGWQLRPITKTYYNTDILLWVDMEETGAYIEVIGNIHDKE